MPHKKGHTKIKKSDMMNKKILDKMNPVQDLIREKGRVYSAVGLSFLDEQINKAMSNPSRGIEQAFSTCYKSILAGAVRALMDNPIDISVNDSTIYSGSGDKTIRIWKADTGECVKLLESLVSKHCPTPFSPSSKSSPSSSPLATLKR